MLDARSNVHSSKSSALEAEDEDSPASNGSDFDKDSFSDEDEELFGTNPLSPDTDDWDIQYEAEFLVKKGITMGSVYDAALDTTPDLPNIYQSPIDDPMIPPSQQCWSGSSDTKAHQG